MARYFYPVLPTARYWVPPNCRFLDPGYEREEGVLHPGEDWNARTGGDTDLGHPLYAITFGIVVAMGFFPAWGNMLELYHPEENIWSVYAHNQRNIVKLNQEVQAGQMVAMIGKGAPDKNKPYGRYKAHLHLELRLLGPDKLPIADWPSARYARKYPDDPERARRAALESIKITRLNPSLWLKEKKAKQEA